MKLPISCMSRVLLLGACWIALAGAARSQVTTIIHSFGDNSVAGDGHAPSAALVQGTNGDFYGTTAVGGSAGLGCVFQITPAGAVAILHSFGDKSVADDGASPTAGLVEGLDGNFYGTTATGGSADSGTVYQITPLGAVTILHSFGDGSVTDDGLRPQAGLIQGADGNFYGTTLNGGNSGAASAGTIFQITPAGAVTILHSFGDGSVTSDGAGPQAGLIQASDGNFYGTTSGGGTGNAGTVFSMTPGNVLTILHNFDDGSVTGDGIRPQAGLVQGYDGNFYGTTFSGGSAGNGAIFKITPPQGQGTTYTCTILHNFGDGSVANDGSNLLAGLIQGADGNFYGTTSAGGGAPGMGGLFVLTPLGQYTLLHNFGDGSVTKDGATPLASLVQGQNGLLYGATSAGGSAGFGTVFSLAPATILLTSASTASGSVSIPFTYQITATQSPTSYTATNLPTGLSIDSSTGLISGTPTMVQTKTVALTLTNPAGSTTVPLTIAIGPLPVPVITSILNSYGSVGTAFSYSIIASNNPTSYGSSTLPSGLTLNTSTGVISGTPKSAATSSVSVTATNAAGSSTAATLSIQIVAPPLTLSQEYIVRHRFGDGSVPNDGTSPQSILQGFDGNFYGVAADGGTFNAGAIFKITEQGVASNFYVFNPASEVRNPTSLIQGADGNFYGTTSSQIFRLSPSGQLTVLYRFAPSVTDAQPTGLIQGYDGNFYGTTVNGGTASVGTIFKITPQGTFTVLHNFGDNSVPDDGSEPNPLVQGTDGNFYGTTYEGGTASLGTVYEMTPSGAVTILHSFGDKSVANDGVNPLAGLVQGEDGNFYGTTFEGGSADLGTVFEITSGQVVTILHSFGDGSVTKDGSYPTAGLIQGYDGNFYGTTYEGGSAGEGTVFEMTPEMVLTIIHNFSDGSVTNDGSGPYLAGLIQGYDGNFYGTTRYGGVSGDGTAYAIVAGQTATHVPIYFGAAYGSGSIYNPFSFTPKATFGVSGSGAIIGANSNESKGNSLLASLVSFLPQVIVKNFTQATYWQLTGKLPLYLTFDSTSGTISGTPVQGGTYTVTITPYNATGAGTAMTVTIYINEPPVITSPATASAYAGTPFSYAITAVPPATSFSATELPGWLSVNPTSGLISGTPPAAGAYLFDALASNISGQASQLITLTVSNSPPNAPIITSATTASGVTGVAFAYQIVADNLPTPTSQGSFGALGIPPGLVFDSATGLISGIPTTAGSYLVPISATNTAGTYASVLSLTITAVAGPAISSSLTASAVQGTAFSYQIVTTPTAGVYTATGLPAGISCDALTGLISGTPTLTGYFSAKLTAGNGTATSYATLTLDVAPTVPINFSAWESLYPTLTNLAATAVPENDGVPNLLKYLFDINPTQPMTAADRAALPVGGTTTVGGTTYLTLTYRQYAPETGLSVYLQTSMDLKNWTTVNPPDLFQQMGNDPNTGDPILEIGVIMPPNTAGQFVRLNVSPP